MSDSRNETMNTSRTNTVSDSVSDHCAIHSSRARAHVRGSREQGTRELGNGDQGSTHPIHPTQLNADDQRSTVDGPIDENKPPTPLATGGIVTSTRGFEKDEPETLIVTGRGVGPAHQGSGREFWIDWDGQGDVVLWSNGAYLGANGWCNVTPVCRRGALPEAIRDEAWALITDGVEDRIAARLATS